MLKFASGVWIGFVLVLILDNVWPESFNSYKRGQIDALNGKISFELKVQEDKTTKWEKIK